MPIQFHILDVSARDEKITSTIVAKKPEQSYEPDDLDEDEEFKPSKRAWNNKTYQKADHSGKTYLVHLFGRTVEGHSIRCDIKGFQPFFYIKAPEGGVTVQRKAIGAIRSYIGRHIAYPDVLSKIQVTSCQRKELFGFTQNKVVPMIKLTMPSKAVFHEVKNLFLNTFSEPELKPLYGKTDSLGDPFGNTVPIVYEANLDPMLRFLHLRNLQPCNWAIIENLDSEDLSLEDSNVLECDWEDIQPCTTPPAPTAPFRLVSWDIECMSNSGEFPMATKGDPIIQIGAILGTLGSKETVKHIFVLGTCTQIPEGIVHVYKTEKALLLGFFQWIADESIDIFMGYNIFGFDEKYAWERCVQLGIHEFDEIQQLNRLYDDTKKSWELETKRLSSSAMGDNFLYLWNTPGRLRVDLYHYIKRGYPLSSYKLDDTSRYFLGESVKAVLEKVDAWELTVGSSKQDVAKGRSVVLLNAGGDTLCEKLDVLEYESGRIVVSLPEDVLADEVASWAIVKDDVTPKEMFALHKQGPDERAIIARYCVQDCQLVLDLFRKLDVFNNAMSMANVCSVPVPYIFLRGQGVKIESLMFKYCYEREQCIKVLTTNHADFESYEGAIVLDPTPGFYTVPVGVADFASLYPSTIISENISHDTLVWVKDYDDKGNQIPVLNKEGDFVRWNVYGSDDYDNLEGMRYTDITYDVMREDPEDTRKVKRTFKAGVRVCRYAQDNIGTIPQIVAGLLAARKAKRKEGANETDPFKKALLDAEQLAYKLTANSLYGQLGSGTFKVRLKALAASVTAYGRKQIMFSKAAIEQFYGPKSGNPKCNASAQIVYGDSVKGDTTLFIKRNGCMPELVRIDELADKELADKELADKELADKEFASAGKSWTPWHETKEAIELSGLQLWTEKGWTSVERLIRHRLAPSKKMFRVLTHTGVVDCTEDHSLVLPNGSEISPKDVRIRTQLLHSDTLWKEFSGEDTTISVEEAWTMGLFLADGSCDAYSVTSGIKYSWAINKATISILETAASKLPFQTKILDTLESSGVYKLVPVGGLKGPVLRYRELFYNGHKEKRVPSEILNAPLDVIQSFMDGFYTGDGDKVGQALGNYRWDQKGKEVCSGLALLAQRLGYTFSINDRSSKPDVFRITCTKGGQRKDGLAIKRITELPTEEIDYVYDLQTENHHFAVGPGSLVVHNTDSLFIAFHPKNPETGKPLEGKEAVQATIALTEEAGKFVSKMLKAPHDFEFDKVYWPFIIFSKKRYVGHKYEDGPDKYKLAFMGIALKRRDYAAIVKRMYAGALNILLQDRDVPKAAAFIQQMAVDLVEGRFGLQPLTISKSLRAEYNSVPAHKMLADRMAERDPGNKPASGDRIPYVYVQSATGQQAPTLQGERIETPSYIKEKGLKPDYMFYIDHQISNPLCQLFGVVVEQIPGFDRYPPPKGGWCTTMPEALIVQRETAAYELLFREAINVNNKGKKSAFAKLLGCKEPVKSVSSQQSTIQTRSQLAAAFGAATNQTANNQTSPSKPKQMSILDSMFAATVKLEASKEATKIVKESAKAKKPTTK